MLHPQKENGVQSVHETVTPEELLHFASSAQISTPVLAETALVALYEHLLQSIHTDDAQDALHVWDTFLAPALSKLPAVSAKVGSSVRKVRWSVPHDGLHQQQHNASTSLCPAGSHCRNTKEANGRYENKSNVLNRKGKDRHIASDRIRSNADGMNLSETTAIGQHQRNIVSGVCVAAAPETEEGCEGTMVLTATCGNITDGSLGRYTAHEECKWIIQPSEPMVRSVYLQFTRFALQPDDVCDFDFLLISVEHDDGKDLLIGKYCSSLRAFVCVDGPCDDLSQPIHLKPPVTLSMITNRRIHGDGFALQWYSSTDEPPARFRLDVPPAERATLKEFYTGLDGDNWEKNSGWNTADTNVCLDWFGVTCTRTPAEDGFLHVQQIKLTNNGLQGYFPTNLGGLPKLRRLQLRSCNLIGTLPSLDSGLHDLVQLDFARNFLTGTLPSQWATMATLEEIAGFDNRLSGTLPSQYAQIATLQYLELSQNRFSGTLPPEWSVLPVFELRLSANLLTGSLPSSWASLPNLFDLYLDQNQFDGTLPPSWGGVPFLDVFNLQTNRISGTLPSQWSALPCAEMALSRNRISGTLPSQWADMSDLYSLLLDFNGLSGTLPNEWGNWNPPQ